MRNIAIAARKTIQKRTAPRRSFSRSGEHEVLLAGGTACPHCSRTLRASDVTIARLDSTLIDICLVCTGCYRDVLVIRSVE